MVPQIVEGDLLRQNVDVIINCWNRNLIPWWLLLPQGVSGAIKREGGKQPFRELAKLGRIPLGEARLTSAGTLPFQGIIHVAGINMFWVATKYSVSESVKNAMQIVHEEEFQSVAFPLIGSGSGNRGQEWSLSVMLEAFGKITSDAEVYIVKYAKNGSPSEREIA